MDGFEIIAQPFLLCDNFKERCMPKSGYVSQVCVRGDQFECNLPACGPSLIPLDGIAEWPDALNIKMLMRNCISLFSNHSFNITSTLAICLCYLTGITSRLRESACHYCDNVENNDASGRLKSKVWGGILT